MGGNNGVFRRPLSNYKHCRMNDLATLPTIHFTFFYIAVNEAIC